MNSHQLFFFVSLHHLQTGGGGGGGGGSRHLPHARVKVTPGEAMSGRLEGAEAFTEPPVSSLAVSLESS